MAASNISNPVFQAFDANGLPLAGGKVYTYKAGTTTPLATYTDSTAASKNTNPIILDSNGRASVWLASVPYKIVLTDSLDVAIPPTMDNVQGESILAGPEWEIFSDVLTYVSASVFSVPGDRTLAYVVGRRLRATINISTLIEGTISSVVYSSVTTVTVTWDSVALNATLSAISAGVLAVIGADSAVNARVSANSAAISEANAATSEANAATSAGSVIREAANGVAGLDANLNTIDAPGVQGMAALRLLTPTSNREQVLAFHSIAGAGGGGRFRADMSGTYVVGDDNNGTVIVVGVNAWVRVHSGYTNVRWFGAVGDGIANDTVAIQSAIDSFPSSGTFVGGTVFIPNGVYLVDGITLKTRVSVIGAGRRATMMVASATSNQYFIQIAAGVVEQITVSDLYISGNTASTSQVCFYINATLSGGQGGLWYSNVKRIFVTNFTSHCLWLRGTHDGTWLTPIQFNTFEDIFLIKIDTNVNTRALLITGQVAQTTFTNLQADGFYGSGGGSSNNTCNIEVSREFLNGTQSGGALIGGALVGVGSPAAIKFITCTTQVSDMGVYIESSNSISIDNCWFEGLRRAITVVNKSVVNLDSCMFSNVSASVGDGSGYYVKTDNSHLTCNAINQQGAYDKSIISVNDSHVRTGGDYFYSNPDAATSGIVSLNIINSRKLYANHATHLNVEASSDYIHSILSNLSVGETLTVTVIDSTNTDRFVKLVDIAGIQLPNGGAALPIAPVYVLRKGDVATFLRTDSPIQAARTWQLVGLVQAELVSNTVPTAGWFNAGDFVRNVSIAPVAAGAPYLLGWTKITGGTLNVLGVDWLACNVTA